MDGTEKYIYINGEEETVFSDGTIQKIDKDKVKTIEYPNGSKVIYHFTQGHPLHRWQKSESVS